MKVFLFILLIGMPFYAMAAEEINPQRAYYQDMNVLHKTAFTLDYLLQPAHFMQVCETLFPTEIKSIPQDTRAQVQSTVKPITAKVQARIAENEHVEMLAMINALYMRSNPEEGIDYNRFFSVYLDKAKKSREIIEQDLMAKKDDFFRFLKLGKVLTLDKCRDRMQSKDGASVQAFWPQSTTMLRDELDQVLAGTPLPDAYKTAYRRLLE